MAVFLYTSDERSSDSPGLTEFNRPLKTEEVNPSQTVLPDFLAILGHEIVCRRHLQNPTREGLKKKLLDILKQSAGSLVITSAIISPPTATAAVNPPPDKAVSARVQRIQDQIGQPQTMLTDHKQWAGNFHCGAIGRTGTTILGAIGGTGQTTLGIIGGIGVTINGTIGGTGITTTSTTSTTTTTD